LQLPGIYSQLKKNMIRIKAVGILSLLKMSLKKRCFFKQTDATCLSATRLYQKGGQQ
jgi:hypothetical protein